MKFLPVCIVLAGSLWLAGTILAQDRVAEQLGIVDEKLNKLSAEVEALQFSQKKLQQQVDDLQDQVLNLRKAGGNGASAADLDAIQAKIKAVDAAREKDKQVILDTLAKELAAISGGKPTSKPAGKPPVKTNVVPGGDSEHVVQQHETLTSIARQYNVTVADLRKANNLSSDALKVGQKLTIPGK